MDDNGLEGESSEAEQGEKPDLDASPEPDTVVPETKETKTDSPNPEEPKPEEPKKAPAKGETSTKGANPLPKFDEVEKAVSEELGKISGHKPGDLLSDRNVAPVFKKLEGMGWTVADRKEIEKLFLPEGDWLVKQFRTEKGRSFLREVARNSGGLDRVDRLRRMPYGERQLSDLMRKPDGYKMVEYMVTTPGGKNLGKSLSRGKNGGKFNESTGRLYTDKQLLDRLKTSHKAELERRGLAS
jgi:hypothetical protein